MTVIVEHDPSQLELLVGAIPGSTAFNSVKDADAHLRSAPTEYAVVVGPSVPADDVTALAYWARINRPALGVVLLRHRVDSTVLADALRSGVREVVEARDLTGVADAVRRSHTVTEAMLGSHDAPAGIDGPSGQVITVFSTKGGVGKSLVATNLAAVLADRGRRVCLVDLDLQSGDVAIMLQLSPTRHVNDLAAFGGVIDEGAVKSLVTEHSPGLSVVAAPVKIDVPDQATPDAVGLLLERARHMFDVVVIDTSGVFDDFALAALDRTDTLVLVGTLDIPALKSLKLATGTLDLLNFPRDRWKFVLNRADAKVGLSVKEFEEALELTADATLASSREVLSAVNRGEVVVRAHPSHAASKAFAALGATIDAATAADEPTRAADGSRRAESARRGLRLRKVG
jgi:pilus assembly protein CpaE